MYVKMSTATSTTAIIPRSRSPSPSTTSKSKDQHNISEHCRQQISFFFHSLFRRLPWMAGGVKASTFIALYLAKSYHANIGHLPAPTQILPVWAAVVMSCREMPHMTLSLGAEQINFALDEAVCQLRKSLGQSQIEDSFDITLTSENTDVPQSSAALYPQRLTQDAYYRYDNLFCCTSCCTWCDVRLPLAW